MAKDTPVLPTPAGRKQVVVVVEEKGWERRNTYIPLPGAGTGGGQEANLAAPSRLSPLKSLCDAALTCNDADRSLQSQHCHTMSGRSALILRGLAVSPFQDGAWLTGTW